MTGARPNVVLLTVDALRADHLGCHGHDSPTSPTLDGLTASHAHFTAAYSASSHTREAMPALLTGQYPDVCVDDSYHLVGDTIAAALADTPYATGAFHSNPFVSRGYGYGRAFDRFSDDLWFGRHKLLAIAKRAVDRLRDRHYAPAEEINDRALSWLDSTSRPVFLWNHYMDPHGPYDPPAAYAREFFGETTTTARAQRLYQRAVKEPDSITAEQRGEMQALYSGEIAYVDAQIDAFLDALAARDILEETIVIVTADHGDAFGEHGYFGHPRRLDDELLRVPMIVRVPEGLELASSSEAADPTESHLPVTVDGPVSTLDVVPTVLDAAGVEREGDAAEALPGESLLAVAGSPERVADRRVFAQARGQEKHDETHLRRFAVRTHEGGGWIERSIESGEVTDGPTGDGDLPEVVRRFSEQRRAVSRRDGTSGEATGDDGADEEVERRLEALGYK